jgi:predicted nucleic acid-binding protein
MSFLLDINIISELISDKPNENVLNWFNSIPDESLYLSVLTIGEIRKGIENVKSKEKKEKLRLWLEVDLRHWFGDKILPINEGVADRWGRLQFENKKTLPAIDSLIAATALHFDLRLVTRNEKDFMFPSLEVINPWHFS